MCLPKGGGQVAEIGMPESSDKQVAEVNMHVTCGRGVQVDKQVAGVNMRVICKKGFHKGGGGGIIINLEGSSINLRSCFICFLLTDARVNQL